LGVHLENGGNEEMNDDDKNLFLLILVLILWTILSALSSPIVGLIGLAIAYRRLAKRFDNKEKED